MPLYSISNMKKIQKIPHEHNNRPIIDCIPEKELHKIYKELNRKIDEVASSKNEIITSGWIPWSDWSNSVWEAIYIAVEKDFSRAGIILEL